MPFPVKTLQVDDGSEFALEWTVNALKKELMVCESVYSTVRPHQALGYLTPQQFIEHWRAQSREKEEVSPN